MTDLLKKFVGFTVLEFFLTHPSLEIHLNELARNLEIARGSAKSYCDALVDEDLIQESSKGNLRLFRYVRFNHGKSGIPLLMACPPWPRG